jgi:hypothetical protein
MQRIGQIRVNHAGCTMRVRLVSGLGQVAKLVVLTDQLVEVLVGQLFDIVCDFLATLGRLAHAAVFEGAHGGLTFRVGRGGIAWPAPG